MKLYFKLVKEFNDTNRDEPAEVIMRVATLPADIIFALVLRIKYRKAIALEKKNA